MKLRIRSFALLAGLALLVSGCNRTSSNSAAHPATDAETVVRSYLTCLQTGDRAGSAAFLMDMDENDNPTGFLKYGRDKDMADGAFDFVSMFAAQADKAVVTEAGVSQTSQTSQVSQEGARQLTSVKVEFYKSGIKKSALVFTLSQFDGRYGIESIGLSR